MLLQVASYLDPKVLYELAPRLWDFVVYALVVGLLSHEIFAAQFKKSKIFGSGSEKIAGILSVILALASAFTLNIQGISLIGVASSGWFNVLFGFLVGLIVYAFTKASFDSRKSLAISFISGAGVVVLLFGLDSIDSLAAKNLIGIVMWGGLFMMLFKTFENNAEASSAPFVAPVAEDAQSAAEDIEEAVEAIDDALNQAQAASHRPLFEESGDHRVLSQAGADWFNSQRAATDNMMAFAQKMDAATGEINNMISQANAVKGEFDDVASKAESLKSKLKGDLQGFADSLIAQIKEREDEAKRAFDSARNKITASVSEVSEQIKELKEAAAEQKKTIDKAASVVSRPHNVSDEVAVSSINDASRELTALLNSVKQSVADFNKDKQGFSNLVSQVSGVVAQANDAVSSISSNLNTILNAENLLGRLSDWIAKLEHDRNIALSVMAATKDVLKDGTNKDADAIISKMHSVAEGKMLIKREDYGSTIREIRTGISSLNDLIVDFSSDPVYELISERFQNLINRFNGVIAFFQK